MLAAAVAMAVGFVLWGLVPNLWVLLIVLIPISFGGILNTVINSVLSKSVYPEEIGGTLGISSSLESLTRVISPVLAAPCSNGRDPGTGDSPPGRWFMSPLLSGGGCLSILIAAGAAASGPAAYRCPRGRSTI